MKSRGKCCCVLLDLFNVIGREICLMINRGQRWSALEGRIRTLAKCVKQNFMTSFALNYMINLTFMDRVTVEVHLYVRWTDRSERNVFMVS